MEIIYYPRLLWRLRAVMIDSIVVPFAMIGCLLLGFALGVTDPIIKWVLFLGPLFLLEPVMVTYTGGTIGHHLMRLRVKRQNGDGNINIFAATLRFVVKLLTGWFSFLFVLTSRRHQALHDMTARSVVVHRDPTRVSPNEALVERKVEEEAFSYPPVWRRVLVILGYSLLTLIVVESVVVMSISYPCISHETCSNTDKAMLLTLDILWLVGTSFSVVLGWKGLLWGARRRAKQKE